MLGKISLRYILTGAASAALIVILWVVAFSPAGAAAQEGRIPLQTAVALTARADVLDQPMSSGRSLGTLAANAQGVVLGGPFNEANWYWVEFTGGTRGYVPGRVLVVVDDKYTPVPQVTATVAASHTAVVASPTARTTVTSTVAPTAVPTQDNVLGAYSGLMLGEMNTGGNVRVAPGVESRRLKTWPQGRRVLLYEQVADSKGDMWYRVSETPEEPMWVHSSLVNKLEAVRFEKGKFKGKWINVNVSQQIVTAYDGDKPLKVTLTSTGTADNPTEIGVWKIYWRLPKQDMQGGNLASGDYYSLKDVPYPQYFHTSGEGLHGTYWHDDFGRPRSHGCVNLSTPMSEWMYGFANIGTTVWVHR